MYAYSSGRKVYRNRRFICIRKVGRFPVLQFYCDGVVSVCCCFADLKCQGHQLAVAGYVVRTRPVDTVLGNILGKHTVCALQQRTFGDFFQRQAFRAGNGESEACKSGIICNCYRNCDSVSVFAYCASNRDLCFSRCEPWPLAGLPVQCVNKSNQIFCKAYCVRGGNIIIMVDVGSLSLRRGQIDQIN